MMTVVRPTRAQGTILGQPVGHKPTLSRVGYLPENARFPKYLTARQALHFFSALSNTPPASRKNKIEQLLESVGMSQWAGEKISTYSKGMVQRLGLAHALVNDPELVVLDEPTDGVDPAGRRDVRQILLGLRQKGVTIFINSHLLSELEMVCDRVAILSAGQVASQGTIDQLSRQKQFYLIELVAPPAPAVASTLREALPGGIWLELEGSILRVGSIDPADIQDLIDSLRRAGLKIRRLHPVRPSLEDLFFEAVASPPAAPIPPTRP
jgi:ABC-2 type transport system ATP-binding protein